MSAKGNCIKQADGTIVYKAVSKTGSPPVELDSSKWYMDKCEIVGYGAEHLTIKVNRDGIIRVDGDFNDGRASRSFFNEYIIPDGVNHEALEFRIYEADAKTLVIVGAIGGGEMVSASAQQIETSSTIKRTEDVRISSTFTETFESTELEGSEDMSNEVRIVDNKFEAKVNVSEYKSEEIQVKISKKVVLIYTSRKEVTKTNTRREIKKTFEIPAGVKPESITSVIGKDGNLTVTAQVDKELAKQQQLQKQIVEQNTDEVLIRVRTVNTTKNVTGDDLKDVKVNNDRFEMNVDLREYKLEEITVKIIKTRRIITISANHKSQFESRSTCREFTLPAGAPDSNPNAVDAVFSPNGILTITGPCAPQRLPAALTDITDDVTNKVVKQQQQNTSLQEQQQNTSVKQQNTSVQQQHTTVQQQNTSVQQQNKSVQQQNTSVQQRRTSVQQSQDTTVQQHQLQQEIVQQSRYTKVTRETFTSSTMTSLDIADETDDNVHEPLVSEPSTPIEDVTQDMVEDEDGNFIVELNIKDYRPEEIAIKASKTTITVVGRKNNDMKEEFCKTVRVPVGIVVTPDKIRSILDKSRRVLTIIITKKVTTTTTEEQTKDQDRIDTVRQQKQQKQESVEETQTKIQTQQQVNQQKQVQQKQKSIEETQTEIQTQQRINQQKQVQQKQKSIEERLTSSTTTYIDIVEETDDNVNEPLVSEPSTPIEDVTQDMVEDEDGNFIVELNIKDYRPEEITIKASKTTITVVGRKNNDMKEEFCKTVRVPVGIVVTPDKIRSILDKSRRVLTIIITKKVTTTTTEEQTKQQFNQQKQVQQKQQSVEETQTEIQTQQRINQQKQVQQKQKSIEERLTSSTTTYIDIVEESDDNVNEPLVSEPSTPIEDVTQDMVEDEDGNFIVELNIKDYRPEEITIKASKTTITVVGRKNNDMKEEFCKTVRVPVGIVVTPDKIRSILDKSTRVLTIIITRKVTITTTEEQERIDTVRQQKQETVEETQRKVQTQQQLHQQKQIQQKQKSVEETQIDTQTQQRINQQKQIQQKQDSIRDTQTDVRTQQQQVQQKQDQRQQNTTNTTTTSKRTLKTTTTTVETLKKLGYNFDSATSQVYTGDPKFFERATQIVDYKPEELEVKIAMPWVIIEGKQEMTAENGWRSKQFTKMFTVPVGVKQENIQLEFNDAGDVVNCTARIG